MGLERAQELATACPDTRVLSVCDREGDVFALLAKADEIGGSLLVRASRSAQQAVLLDDGTTRCLWDHDAHRPVITITPLTIPAAGGPRGRKARDVRLEIRAGEIRLVPPQDAKGAEPLSLFAVSATEIDPPKDQSGKAKDQLHGCS